MNYADNLNFYGHDVKEIPCVTGSGSPQSTMSGAVGLLYMYTDNGNIYKCIAATNETSSWELLVGGGVDKKYVDDSIQSAILDSWEVEV